MCFKRSRTNYDNSDNTLQASGDENESEPEYDEDSDEHGSDDEHDPADFKEQPDTGTFVYVEAPFNRDVAKRWCNRLVMRQMRYGCLTWADYLGALPLRALSATMCRELQLPSGSWTRDRFKESATSLKLDLKPSLEPSADRTCEDVKLKHERVGGHLRGLSVFAGPKLLRMLSRAGVKAQIYDVVNSHLRHLHNALHADRRPLELVEIVDSRQRIMQELLTVISNSAGRAVELSDIKKLILAMTYGGSAKKHLLALGCSQTPPWLANFQACIRKMARAYAKAMPDRIKILKELGKRDPTVSLLSYIGIDLQRQTTDRMQVAVQAKGRVVSFERDCIVGVGCSTLAEVEKAAGVPLTLETYADEDAVVEQLRLKFPFADFSVDSEFDYTDVVKARACCLSALQPVVKPGKKPGDAAKVTFPTPKNTTDFGLVIAAHLEATVICGEGKAMEFWDRSATSKHGKWNTVLDRDAFLTMLTRKSLLKLFLPTKLELEDGKWVPTAYGAVPPACKYRGFYVQVSGDAALVLRRPRPPVFADGTDTRDFLQDCHGLIYSFATDRFYAGEPSIRVTLNLPWGYFKDGHIGTPDSVWPAPPATKARLLELLDKVFAYFLAGDGPEGKSLEADPVFGKPLADALRAFVLSDSHCKVWHLLLPFVGNCMDFMV